MDAQYIHFKVTVRALHKTFYCTIVYGFNGVTDQKSIWNRLKYFALTMTDSWMVAGDFNNMLSPYERVGSSPVSLAEIKDFRECLVDCSLKDMRWRGCKLTWSNKHVDGSRVWSK